MSIESAFKAEKLDFPYMNQPEPPGVYAYISHDKNHVAWITCPHCGKRQFPLTEGAIIKGQMFKCKGSSCKREYLVDIDN